MTLDRVLLKFPPRGSDRVLLTDYPDGRNLSRCFFRSTVGPPELFLRRPVGDTATRVEGPISLLPESLLLCVDGPTSTRVGMEGDYRSERNEGCLPLHESGPERRGERET